MSDSIFSRFIIIGFLAFKLSTNFGHSSNALGSITTILNGTVFAVNGLLCIGTTFGSFISGLGVVNEFLVSIDFLSSSAAAA